MPRSVSVDLADWESICITRSIDPDNPGYVITITYELAGGGLVLRRQRHILSGQLSAARQTALANLDADVLSRIKGIEGV